VRLPPGPLRAAVLLEAASFRPAPELCAQALAESGADPDLRVRAELQLSRQGIYEFDPDSSLRHARKAVDAARTLGDPVLLAAALTQLGVVEFLLGGVTPLPALDEALRL
jgi:hypothetical protein